MGCNFIPLNLLFLIKITRTKSAPQEDVFCYSVVEAEPHSFSLLEPELHYVSLLEPEPHQKEVVPQFLIYWY
jgi:hypothetical protein